MALTNYKDITIQCPGEPTRSFKPKNSVGSVIITTTCNCTVFADGQKLPTNNFPCYDMDAALKITQLIPAAWSTVK